MRISVIGAALAVLLGACAGRDPQPVATVQVQDQYASCTQISAEVQANNIRVKELADEQGLKVAQNVGAGVVGLVIWPVWFGMDFKGAAGKEVAALQARQQYLSILATERCSQPAPPAAVPMPGRRGQQPPRTQAQPRVQTSPPVMPAVPEPEEQPLPQPRT